MLLRIQVLWDMDDLEIDDDGRRRQSCSDGTRYRWVGSGTVTEDYSDLDDHLDGLRVEAHGVLSQGTAINGEDAYVHQEEDSDVDDLEGRIDRWRSTDDRITLQVELVTTPEGPIRLSVSGETECR